MTHFRAGRCRKDQVSEAPGVERARQTVRVAPWQVAALCLLAAARAAAQQPPPRFQSTVEITTIDVNVLDDAGRPITNLRPDDFVVRVDERPRRVSSAEWLPTVREAKARAATPVPDGYTSNEASTGGRLVVLAIDQPNLRPEGTRTLKAATDAFIDNLTTSDRMAVVGFGPGAPATPFVSDHDRLKRAIGRMVGGRQRDMIPGGYNIAFSEAVAMFRGEGAMRDAVVGRECAGLRGIALTTCGTQVEGEAAIQAEDAAHGFDETVRGLRDLLMRLKSIDQPKTLIVVSSGFSTNGNEAVIAELGALAAVGQTALYALHLEDDQSTDVRLSPASNADRTEMRNGLDLLAVSARGAMFPIVGNGASAFARVQAETTGYYLLGVESDPRDRDGKPHQIRISVSQRGSVVRARRLFSNTPSQAALRSSRQVVAAGLNSPLPLSALPLRVATFSLQGPEQGRVQLLIHADVGNDYTATKAVSIGYMIFDKAERIVETRMIESRLTPVMKGVPSALQFAAGASLAPGEYTLKLVAAEGDRAGSVEHTMHAVIAETGKVKLSDLIAGGPVDDRPLLQPTVGYTVTFGSLHGYVEAYGSQAETVTVKYEVAVDQQSPALLSADVPGWLAGDDRMIFSLVFPVNQLPPGRYVLRAAVSAATKPVETLVRSFEMAAPVVPTAAADAGTAPPDDNLFLSVDEQTFKGVFHRDEVLAADALRLFEDRVAASVKSDFEAGVASLAAGDYAKAEASLTRAIQPDVDSTAGMTYLGAVFAASGRDVEAAAAWQTALIDGAEVPQVWDWASQALLRLRALTEARSILEEATGRWPSDPRFTRPLAMLYALFGEGSEAIRTLERYLEVRGDDRDALRLGVEWIYQTHAGGRVVHSDTEDLQLARTYSEQYAKASGPQSALVKQWLDFLENERNRKR